MVVTIENDSLLETDEQFRVMLEPVVTEDISILLKHGVATITILDDDCEYEYLL